MDGFDLAEATEFVSGGTVWVGLVFLAIKALVAVVGTRAERAQAKYWSRLHDHLELLATNYTAHTDKLLAAYERATSRLPRDNGESEEGR